MCVCVSVSVSVSVCVCVCECECECECVCVCVCARTYNILVDSTRIWDSSPFSGMVRLQGGTYSNDGRVEIYCNGQWGTVCDDIGYTYNTGNTICKQLGYSGASFLISLAGYVSCLIITFALFKVHVY